METPRWYTSEQSLQRLAPHSIVVDNLITSNFIDHCGAINENVFVLIRHFSAAFLTL